MEIKPALVKELRERTGAGMMDCKRALVEAAGDIDLAADVLRKAGQAKADKKASRVAAEGQVLIKSDHAAGRHVIVEVNSETDFVAKDENFRGFLELVADLILNRKPASVEELMQLPADGRSLEEARQALVAKVGENIAVRRFQRVETSATVGPYLHMGRIGVLLELEGGNADLARDLAMQIAATSPRYVAPENVPQEELAKEREILSAQAAAEKKPPEIVAKMVEGRLKKHLEEITLTGQPFVKDPDRRVRELLAANSARVKGFLRYEVGEGIEKKASDFVQEVMARALQSR
ncbi:MAG TPA: translation elongation factor Ts [Gammaproteobacteria bacterium]|nr:translation elongation factor Ts [Gammaproteobacteria bacterium]